MNDVVAAKPRRSWGAWSRHAGIMLLACWAIYMVCEAIFRGRIPTGFRMATLMIAEATGYFLVAILLPLVIVFFSRLAGWVVWIVAVGFMAYGLTSSGGGQTEGRSGPDFGHAIHSSASDFPISARPAQLSDRELSVIVSKANESLPMMLDRDTRADTSMAYPGLTLAYFYTYLPASAAEIKQEALLESAAYKSVRSQVCGSPNSKRLLSDGVTFQYIYRGNDGVEAFRFSIASSDC